MLVLPLGLGTQLRRLPILTIAISCLWVAVALLDRSSDRISDGLLGAVAQSGVRDASRNLFIQFCRSHHGAEARCRKYAILVWTGFPASSRHRRLTHQGAEATAMMGEFKAAEALRKELSDCRRSRSCFSYKDIIWSFLDDHEHRPAAFASLKGYDSYRSAVRLYRSELQRLCAANLCLVKGNINLPSLVAAQLRHGGFLHLAGNLFAFLVFGVYVEQRTRRWAYLLVVALGGTVGMAVHAYAFGSIDTIALGGSANVSTVMGMFYVFFFHARMRFLVWLPRKIYAGSSYFAEVKYCFPLLFVLSDISGGFDNGFADLAAGKVAHFAHLTGLLVGMLAAYILTKVWPVPRPLLYEDEVRDMHALEGTRDMESILKRAEGMVAVNPENVHAQEFACSAFLRWNQVAQPAEQLRHGDRGRSFLIRHLPAVCAINVRAGQLRYAAKLLSQVPLSMPYRVYAGRVGQLTSLTLADFALKEGHPLLALRLYDFFLCRYPLSRKCRSVEDTAADLISNLTPSRENLEAMSTYLLHHPESMVAPHLGAWLTNAQARSA